MFQIPIVWFGIVIVASLLLMFLFPKKRVKVYGSKDCGWTVKQLEYLGDRAEFIDCKTGKCPEWVTGYPGVETPDGKKVVGFTKV